MTPEERSAVCRFIARLSHAGLSASLYALSHPQTVKHIESALAILREQLPESGEVTFMRIESDLFLEGRPLPRDQYLERFVRSLKEHRISQVTISRDSEPAELELLARMIARKSFGTIESTDHIQFATEELEIEASPASGEEPPFRSFNDIPEDLKERVAETFEACANHEPLDLSSIVAVVSGFITAFRKEANPFLALVPLRQMDEYTFTHSIDVCILNLAQGMSLGFEGQLLHDIGIAAMLHDIGKLFVPKEVLQKPGDLDDAEWALMRQHTVKGAEYLLNNPGIPRLAVLSSYEHHMRYDLSGYPKPPVGWQINLASQITMVSDCFDAMRTRRVYKEVVDFGRVAGRMLEISGTMLNPSLTLNFLNLLKKMGERL